MEYNVFLLPHIINALRVFLHSYSLKTVQCMSECSVCVQLPHIVLDVGCWMLDAGRAARYIYAVRLNCHATEANEPSGTHCVTAPHKIGIFLNARLPCEMCTQCAPWCGYYILVKNTKYILCAYLKI